MTTYAITEPVFSKPVTAVPGWVSTPFLGVFHVFSENARTYPVWEGGDIFSVRVDGFIDGTVEDPPGSPVGAGVAIMVHWRKTGLLIARTETDANGYFSVPYLDPTVPADPQDGKYYVVCLDPTGGTLHNALIADRAVPRV